MQTSSLSFLSKLQLAGLLFGLALSFGCQKNVFQPEPAAPPAMKSVPAVRLNYRYEADVPAPAIDANARAADRNSLVQSDFDKNKRTEERSVGKEWRGRGSAY